MSTSKRQRKFAQHLAGENLTVQYMKDECDINNIVAKYTRATIDPAQITADAERKALAQYGTAPTKDFAQAMREVAEVNSAFAELPALERAHYSNDPRQWINTISQPAVAQTPETTSEGISQPLAGSGETSSTPAEPAPQDSTQDRASERSS